MSVDLVPWCRAVSSYSARLSKLKIITKAVIAHFAAAQHAAAAVLTINKRRGWLFAFVLRLNFELSHSNVTVLLFVSFVLFCHFRFNFFYILRLKRYSCSFSVYFFYSLSLPVHFLPPNLKFGAAFSTPASQICCLPHYPVLRFPPLQFRAAFFTPVYSTSAFSASCLLLQSKSSLYTVKQELLASRLTYSVWTFFSLSWKLLFRVVVGLLLLH